MKKWRSILDLAARTGRAVWLPLTLLLMAGWTLEAQTIQNSDFEMPVVGPVGDYYSWIYNPDPSTAGWTFVGNAGIAANGSGFAFYNGGTPDGNQFAFLQGLSGVGGSISQALSMTTAADYTFTFIASQRDIVGRDNSQNQTVIVLVDGVNVGLFTPPDTNWYSYSTTPIFLSARNHTLLFTNLAVPGDATVRLDTVGVLSSNNYNPTYSTNYFVDWFKIAGGGGTSTSAVYSVTGTFGQQDAGGTISGGGYTVTLGFWSLLGQAATSELIPTPPLITEQPQSQFVNLGSPASFSVSVSGTPPFSYQWQKNGVDLSDGNNVSGSQTANLALSTTSTNDAGSYLCVVRNAYGNVVTSGAAKLTLIFPNLPVQIQNPGFEFPGVGPVGEYVSFLYNPTGAVWTFVGDAGIAANGSGFAFFNAGTPDGNQFAFLQGRTNAGGSMSQTIAIGSPGNYAFGFLASQRDIVGRDNSQNQTAIVSVDGVNVGSFTPPDTNWYACQTATITLSPGNHVLTFTDLPVAGDATVRIDQVNVATNWAFPPRITVGISGGSFQFSWNALSTYPAVAFQVQYTTDLASGNWQNLGSVQSATNFTDAIGSDPQRFYRVLLVQ